VLDLEQAQGVTVDQARREFARRRQRGRPPSGCAAVAGRSPSKSSSTATIAGSSPARSVSGSLSCRPIAAGSGRRSCRPDGRSPRRSEPSTCRAISVTGVQYTRSRATGRERCRVAGRRRDRCGSR
jgi:hypothetical protein